jgi:hypothetical protein
VLTFSLFVNENMLEVSQTLSPELLNQTLNVDRPALWHFRFQPISGQRAIYVLGEGYHPLWIATQKGRELIKLPINGILNGFIATGSQGPIDVEFAPDASFHVGMTLTEITVPFVLGAIAVFYELPWLSRRFRWLRMKLFDAR